MGHKKLNQNGLFKNQRRNYFKFKTILTITKYKSKSGQVRLQSKYLVKTLFFVVFSGAKALELV